MRHTHITYRIRRERARARGRSLSAPLPLSHWSCFLLGPVGVSVERASNGLPGTLHRQTSIAFGGGKD
eukprot:scaffold198125_cov31-Tisochrysis_lutea.AAC.6